MKEKDIRDRIGQFLQKTARTMVVPASVGLGLSSVACNHNGVKTAGDAGWDGGVVSVDASAITPDLASDLAKHDVPMMMVPYLIAMAPDAALDSAGETVRAPDADSDAVPDARSDIAYPPPPYLVPPLLPDELTSGSPPTPPTKK